MEINCLRIKAIPERLEERMTINKWFAWRDEAASA
jgi:hypothetical protein